MERGPPDTVERPPDTVERPRVAVERPPVAVERPPAAAYVLVPLLYLLGAILGSNLTMTPEGISILWPSTAVLLAAFVRYRGAGWAAFSVLGILAEIAADLPRVPVEEALAFGVANVIEATVAWRLLVATGFDARFERVTDVSRFVLAGPGAGALVGALVGTALLALVRPLESGFLDAAMLWWFGDGLGLLVFTPVYLAFSTPDVSAPPVWPGRPAADVVVALAGAVLLLLFVLSEEGQVFGLHVRSPLLFPFVVYAATRLSFRGVTLVVLFLSLLLAFLAAAGRAPVPGPAKEIWTQEVIAVVAVLALGLSALLRCLRVAEEEVSVANAALRRHADALERTNLELRRINYIAAHELRTPLRGIGSFSQLLAAEFGEGLGPVGKDWVRRVLDNVGRLDALLRDLGVLSAVDVAPTRFDPIDMGALVDEVVGGLAEKVATAAAVVTRDELPRVHGDRAQLFIVLEELLSNALLYRGAAPPRVHVSARRGDAEWVIAVRDNGVGIAREHQPRIFDIFYRVPTRQATPGTGGGLALCARVVHRHGGRIWLDSAPGVGSTFSFSLPDMAGPR